MCRAIQKFLLGDSLLHITVSMLEMFPTSFTFEHHAALLLSVGSLNHFIFSDGGGEVVGIDNTNEWFFYCNRNFYHPYLLSRRESMSDMDPNLCALESTGLELSNARGFKSKFVTVAIISWLEHEWFWENREFQRNFLPSLFLREQAKYQKHESEAVCVSKIKISTFEHT